MPVRGGVPGGIDKCIRVHVKYLSYHHDRLLAVRFDGCEVMAHGGIISRRLAAVGRRSADVLATGHSAL